MLKSVMLRLVTLLSLSGLCLPVFAQAFEKIRKLLAAHGATMSDVVKLVTYVVDIRDRDAMNKCRAEAFKGSPLPMHTFLAISQLARPGMLVEMDVIAVTGK